MSALRRSLLAWIAPLLLAAAGAYAFPPCLDVLVPLRLQLTLESEAAASVTVRVFPRPPSSAEPPDRQVTPRVPTRIEERIPRTVRAVGVDLGPGRGAATISDLRVVRLWTLAEWDAPEELAAWRSRSGVAQRGDGEGEISLQRSGDDPTLLVHPALADALEDPLRRQRRRLGLVGALVGALAGLWPAGRAWRRADSSQRRWMLRLAWYCAIVAGAAAVLVPLAMRRMSRPGVARYQDPTGDYDFSFLSHAGQRVSTQIGGLGLLLDPFCFFRNYPGQSNASLSIDAHGFRGGVPAGDRPLAFVLGGSTAFGFGLQRDDQALSARLGERIPELAFVNAGVSGYASGQELALMLWRLDDWRPTRYVVLDGWNDYLEACFYPRSNPGILRLPVLGVNGQYFKMEQRLSERARSESGEPLPAWPFQAPLVDSTLESRFEDGLRVYCANLERMSTWAQARGARLLVAFQPEKESKRSLTDMERSCPSAGPEVSAGYRRFVHEAALRCEELGIDYVNLLEAAELVESEETLFIDPCHLTPRGYEIMADVLARRLREDG